MFCIVCGGKKVPTQRVKDGEGQNIQDQRIMQQNGNKTKKYSKKTVILLYPIRREKWLPVTHFPTNNTPVEETTARQHPYYCLTEPKRVMVATFSNRKTEQLVRKAHNIFLIRN